MEVFDGHTPPKPTGLLELAERSALEEAVKEPVPLAVEMEDLSREQVCSRALRRLLQRQKHARAQLEQAESGSTTEAGAQLDMTVTNHDIEMVTRVAGEVIVYQATEELKRAA